MSPVHSADRRDPAPMPLHAVFLAILPRIELHGLVYFRHAKDASKKEEFIAEMIALNWKWRRRLAARGKDVTQFPQHVGLFRRPCRPLESLLDRLPPVPTAGLPGSWPSSKPSTNWNKPSQRDGSTGSQSGGDLTCKPCANTLGIRRRKWRRPAEAAGADACGGP